MDTSMRIVVTRGTGTGRTGLSAFDGALHDAGIANLNLLVLSSVIPPGSLVRCGGSDEALAAHAPDWGDRLYCVLAEARAEEPGAEAWAGLGWWQGADGRGIFVEQHGTDRADVESRLAATLDDCLRRRGLEAEVGCRRFALSGDRCVDRPVCALVAATYRTSGWDLG